MHWISRKEGSLDNLRIRELTDLDLRLQGTSVSELSGGSGDGALVRALCSGLETERRFRTGRYERSSSSITIMSIMLPDTKNHNLLLKGQCFTSLNVKTIRPTLITAATRFNIQKTCVELKYCMAGPEEGQLSLWTGWHRRRSHDADHP